MMSSLVGAGSRRRKKLGGSFILDPAKGLATSPSLFFSAGEQVGWWERIQVGEENVTIRKLSVHPDPRDHRTTEVLHMTLLLYMRPMTHPCSMHHVGYKRYAKNKMRQRGWLQSLLRIWVSSGNSFKQELPLCQTDGLFPLFLSH